MLNKAFFVFFFCFCFSQKTIHDFGDEKIVDFDFYFETQKNSWDNLSDENKKKGFDGFLKKELVSAKAHRQPTTNRFSFFDGISQEQCTTTKREN